MKAYFAAAALAAFFVSPVQAQELSNCAPREIVIEQLADRYGESRQSVGVGDNVLVETFASLETGTWTITATNVNGMTCMIASGQAFELLSEHIPEGDPA